MNRTPIAKRIARVGTRGRLIARQCAALTPLREPRRRGSLACAALLALACVALVLGRA